MIAEGFMEFSCETMWELMLSCEELFHYFLYSSFHESCSTSVLCLWSLFLEYWVLNHFFHCPHSPSSRGSLVYLHFLSLKWHHLHIWGCWCFSQQSWFQLVIHSAWHYKFWLGRSGWSLDSEMFESSAGDFGWQYYSVLDIHQVFSN